MPAFLTRQEKTADIAIIVTYQHLAEAIAAFERTLMTPSRFDDFLNGDAQALSQAEQRGLKTFIKQDCKS